MYKNPSLRKFEKMSADERFEFMATANRVTVGHMDHVQGRKIQRFYVAKIRNIVISNDDGYKFATPDEARDFGKKTLENWKREYTHSSRKLPTRD